MILRSMADNLFYLKSTLAEWEQVRDWMTANKITWHAHGNNVMSFDNKEHAVMFALKWA